jgi:organic radical activating enzyme
MEKQSYYCPAPWHGGYFTQEGCAVCCILPVEKVSPAELLTSPTTQAIKQGLVSGDLHPACASCIDKEKHGFRSMRLNHLAHAEEFNTVHDYTTDSATLPQIIEIRFTNVCNFKCRMCYSGFSNLIANEIIDNPSVLDWYHLREEHKHGVVESGKDTKFFKELVDISKTLKRLYLTGGEPSVSKAVTDYMKSVIDLGYAENIHLAFSTNAGAINPLFVNLLPKFKESQIILSLDAVGKIAEYQRHGTVWDRVVKNVEYYQQVTPKIAVHAVITAYSVLGIDKFFEYLESTGLNLDTSICYDDFYKVQALIGPARASAIEAIHRAINIANNSKHLSVQVPRLTSLLTFLKDSPEIWEDWELFYKRSKAFDQIRNESFEEVFGFSLNLPG